MVVLKRKANGETERGYEGYDSVIELDDRKSFAASQKEVGEPEIYTSREAFVKPREEVMPSIKKETKPAIAPAKQAVSAKAKVLLAAYIVIAVVLAAIVIGTGLALTEIGDRNLETSDRIVRLENQINDQNSMLDMIDNPNYLAGAAMNEYHMSVVNEDEVVVVTLIPEVAVASYSPTENWFGRFCDFLSGLFN